MCRGCFSRFDPAELTMDHIVPASKGGKDGLENLQLMCEPCNNKKADKVVVKR